MGKQQIKIELIDHMGSDLSTVNSARVSFDKESEYDVERTVDNIGCELSWCNTTNVLKESDKKLIKYLASHRHTTPFRHNQVTIRCHAPIFLARQLGKHQAGLSWNEVSRRYVDSEPEFFVPDEWRGRPDGSIKQGSGGDLWETPKYVKDRYEGFIATAHTCYTDMLEAGVAPEMARMVLPQSMMTSWYWSGNLLAFAHVYKERINEGAQLEAQWFAEELDKVIRPLFPESWKALVDG